MHYVEDDDNMFRFAYRRARAGVGGNASAAHPSRQPA